MRHFLLISLVCWFAALIRPVAAHQVETVELEFQRLENEWRLVGEMDIAYMLPETRKVAGAMPLSREAVMNALPEELARIRRETERTLRQLLRITFAGKDVAWRIEFPDFDKEPFELPEEAMDWALLTTRIVVEPQPGPGDLKIHWSGEEEAELIILTEDSEDGQIVSVLPGGSIDLLHVEESGTAAAAKQSVAGGWVLSGFRHVLPLGYDHMLFILGLFLMIPKWKPLLKQSLMFTVAHSLTLALAVLGWIHVPSRAVEILIAFSIAFIGVENLVSHKVAKLRLFIVLAFGLIHGMGFASVLAEQLDGIPRERYVGPLLGFNVGVELAQITVLASAFLILWPLKRWTRQVQIAGSVFVTIAGVAWMIERIAA